MALGHDSCSQMRYDAFPTLDFSMVGLKNSCKRLQVLVGRRCRQVCSWQNGRKHCYCGTLSSCFQTLQIPVSSSAGARSCPNSDVVFGPFLHVTKNMVNIWQSGKKCVEAQIWIVLARLVENDVEQMRIQTPSPGLITRSCKTQNMTRFLFRSKRAMFNRTRMEERVIT